MNLVQQTFRPAIKSEQKRSSAPSSRLMTTTFLCWLQFILDRVKSEPKFLKMSRKFCEPTDSLTLRNKSGSGLLLSFHSCTVRDKRSPRGPKEQGVVAGRPV